MPSLITHYEFSKQYFKDKERFFYIASQGPDVYFYNGYSFFPTKNKKKQEKIKNIRSFGSYLHEIDPYISFSFLIQKVSEEKDESKRKLLLNFVEGMMSHYILDRVAHPYVYYVTGFPLSEKMHSFYHMYLETCLNVLVMDYYKDYPSFKEVLKPNKEESKEVSLLMYELAEHLSYEGIEDTTYSESLKTMLKVNRVINSKVFGLRKWFLNKFMKFSSANSMSIPKLKNLPKEDIANLKKKEYFDTVTNESKRNDTFFEILDKASKELKIAITIIEDIVIKNLDVYDELNRFLNKIDHDGVKVGSEMKYSDVIFTPDSFK